MQEPIYRNKFRRSGPGVRAQEKAVNRCILIFPLMAAKKNPGEPGFFKLAGTCDQRVRRL
jgi:hypothetical protein